MFTIEKLDVTALNTCYSKVIERETLAAVFQELDDNRVWTDGKGSHIFQDNQRLFSTADWMSVAMECEENDEPLTLEAIQAHQELMGAAS